MGLWKLWTGKWFQSGKLQADPMFHGERLWKTFGVIGARKVKLHEERISVGRAGLNRNSCFVERASIRRLTSYCWQQIATIAGALSKPG
jgi:hypothetical protein